jgi:hypothetical protein
MIDSKPTTSVGIVLYVASSQEVSILYTEKHQLFLETCWMLTTCGHRSNLERRAPLSALASATRIHLATAAGLAKDHYASTSPSDTSLTDKQIKK